MKGKQVRCGKQPRKGKWVRNKEDASYSLPTLHVTARAGKREPVMQWSHFHDLRATSRNGTGYLSLLPTPGLPVARQEMEQCKKKKKNAITGPRRGGSRNRAMWCSSHVTSQENAFQLYTLGYGTEEESFNNDVVLPQIPATRYYAQKECCPSEYTKQFVIMLLGTFRSQKLFVLRKPAIKNHGPQKGLVG